MDKLKQKVVHGMFWSLAERFGSQAMSFVVGIVLSRLLGPEAFGTVALLTIFIVISNVFVDSGFTTALVQKKDVTEVDLNSVFYLNVGISIVVYGALFVCAPAIASFYSRPVLIPVLRISAISLVLNGLNVVQNAVLARRMLFNLSFRISLAATFVNGVIGIAMAYRGYGVWALVWSSVLSNVVATCIRWSLIKWRPGFEFSTQSVMPLFKFGWKLLASSLLDNFFSNLYGLLIGRIYSPTDLALYNKGQSLPRLAMDSINGTLGGVAFPALSQLQNDKARLKEAMRRMIQVSTFAVMPIMALLAAAAEPLTLFLYGDKWRDSIVFIQIACIPFAFWPFHTINLQGINAIGRSDMYLKLEIIKKAICLGMLAIMCKFGVVVFALAGAFLMTPLSLIVNCWPNRKLLAYGLREQIADALSVMVVSGALFGVVWSVSLIRATSAWGLFCVLAAQGVVAVVFFVLAVRIARPVALMLVLKQFPSLGQCAIFRGILR